MCFVQLAGSGILGGMFEVVTAGWPYPSAWSPAASNLY